MIPTAGVPEWVAGNATAGPETAVGRVARRVSVGSALSRAALGAFVRAAGEIREHGTFGFGADAVPRAEANALMAADGSE